MKYQKVVLEMCKCLLVCIVIFLSFPGTAKAENNKPTVDDLFQYLVDEWANQIEYSMYEASVITGEPIVGLPLKPNYKEVLVDFGHKLINSEDTWGHLPEYWQLRAQIERDNGLDWIEETEGGYVSSPFSNRLDDLKLNQDLLQNSFDLEPKNGEVKWFLGMLEHERNFPEKPKYNPFNTEPEKNYYKSLMQINVDAGAVNPINAFYPLHEAAFHYQMGDLESAIESLKRAGECEYFFNPRLFPSGYALNHMNAYESGKEPFDNLAAGGKQYLYLNFYGGTDALMNYIPIKGMYKDIIADSHSKDNWRDTLNILHKAACVLGKGEGNETINHLVAIVLVKFCLKEAHIQAIEMKDANLERAVALALEKNQIPKIVIKFRNVDNNDIFRFLYSILVDEMNQSFGDLSETLGDTPTPCITLSRFLPPKLEILHHWRIHENFIKPVFEELETFDYNNPNEWYESWLEKTLPDLYKPEEEK
ncbi:hypothetical protein KKB99_06155 [bacterium]|nr:hypothetical protein [bacterium]MBU1025570.1 hypothetical protein [bacterium]